MKKKLLALLLAGVMVLSQTGMTIAAENPPGDQTMQTAENEETESGEDKESGDITESVQDEDEEDAVLSDVQDADVDDASENGLENASGGEDEAAVQDESGAEDAAADDEDAPDAVSAGGSDESSLPGAEDSEEIDDAAESREEDAEEAVMNVEQEELIDIEPDNELDVGSYYFDQNNYEFHYDIDGNDTIYTDESNGTEFGFDLSSLEGIDYELVPEVGTGEWSPGSGFDNPIPMGQGWNYISDEQKMWFDGSELYWNAFERIETRISLQIGGIEVAHEWRTFDVREPYYDSHGMLENIIILAREKHHVDKTFTMYYKGGHLRDGGEVTCTISSLSYDFEEDPFDPRAPISLTQDEDENGWVITAVREGEENFPVKFYVTLDSGSFEAETDFRVTVGRRRGNMRLVSETGSNRLQSGKTMLITPQFNIEEYDWDTGEQIVLDTSRFEVQYEVRCTHVNDTIVNEEFGGDFEKASKRGGLWDYEVNEENHSVTIVSKKANSFDLKLEVKAFLIDSENGDEAALALMTIFVDKDIFELDLTSKNGDQIEWDQMLPPGGMITLSPVLMRVPLVGSKTPVHDETDVTYRFEYHEGRGKNDPAIIEILDVLGNPVASGKNVTQDDGPFTIWRKVNQAFDFSICASWNDGGEENQEERRDLYCSRMDFGSGFIRNNSRGNPRYTWYYQGEEIEVVPDRTKLDELAGQGYDVQTEVEAGFFDDGVLKPFGEYDISGFFDEQNGLHVGEDVLAGFYDFLRDQADKNGSDWRRLALRIHSEINGVELVDHLLQITITNPNPEPAEFRVEFRNADGKTMNDLDLLIGHKQELVPYVTCTEEDTVTVISNQPGGDYYYEAGDVFYDDRVLSFDRDTWEVTPVRQGNTTLEIPITIYDSDDQKLYGTMAILNIHTAIVREVLTVPEDAVFYAAPGRTYTAHEILNSIQPVLTVYSMRNPDGEEYSISELSNCWIMEVIGGGGKVVAEDGDNMFAKITVSSDAAEGELKLVIGTEDDFGHLAEAECRVQIQSPEPEVCTHDQVSKEVKQATLTTDGAITTICSKCGETLSTTKISHPATFKLAVSTCTYTGAALKPAVTVTDAEGKAIEASNYTVAYTNNVNAGTATAKVTFKGNYSGSKALTFKIAPAAAKTFTLAGTKYVYTGSALKPVVTVKDAADKVIAAANYTVVYKNNVNAGTATASVTLKGNYSGSKALTFTIAPARAKTFTLDKKKYVYTGSAMKPAVTVKDAAGKVIAASDYTVAYSKNKNPGMAVVKVTMKGNYTGKKTLKFKINPKPTNLSEPIPGSKSVTVKWEKQAVQTSGYEIQYSLKSSFSGAKKVLISKNKTVSKKITGLKSGKSYYLRIRTYKKVSGKKYYSTWSKKKAVTVK